jgi:hypothetical protein
MPGLPAVPCEVGGFDLQIPINSIQVSQEIGDNWQFVSGVITGNTPIQID